jgi:MSHA biogenesis protein MshI
MSAISTLAGPWLRRLRRARFGASEVQVGAQWVGAELVLARVRSGEPPQIDQVAIFPAPPEARADLVKRLADGGLLRGASLVIALAPGQYDLHSVAAPAVPADELRDALRWQLRGSLAYAPEEVALDFVRLPHADAQHPRDSLLVVTAHRPTVDAAVAPFAVNGVTVDAVDAPEFAQRNLDQLYGPTAGCSAWLGFERETCLLTAHAAGELAFARRMLLPGANLNAIDADTAESVAHVTDRIVTQAQRTLDLFERQSGLPPVTRITVGPHRHAAAIVAELAERTGVTVARFDARSAFEFSDAAANWAAELPGTTLPAVGAALRTDDDAAETTTAWRAGLVAALKRTARRRTGEPGAEALAAAPDARR